MMKMIGLNAGFEGLDPEQFCDVYVSGHGKFVIPSDLAKHVAAMCGAAQAMSESIHGIQVPVYLVGIREQFITCIKFVRQVTGKNLKDAKEFCDKARGGQKMLLGRYPWNKAQAIKDEGEEHSAIIETPSPLEMLAEQSE